MIAKITPITVFGFGSADALSIRLVQDDLESNAVFIWQLGRLVSQPLSQRQVIKDGQPLRDSKTLEPVMESFQPDPVFRGADNIIGNVTLSGDDYTAWNGSNDTITALVLAKLPEQLTLSK
jgi:hypothetical protein